MSGAPGGGIGIPLAFADGVLVRDVGQAHDLASRLAGQAHDASCRIDHGLERAARAGRDRLAVSGEFLRETGRRRLGSREDRGDQLIAQRAGERVLAAGDLRQVVGGVLDVDGIHGPDSTAPWFPPLCTVAVHCCHRLRVRGRSPDRADGRAWARPGSDC